MGTTPLTADIDRKLHDSLITFAFDGCDLNETKLLRAFNKVAIANITIWPGWTIDAFTGAINKSVYPEYHADLKCEPNDVSEDVGDDEDSS